MAKGSTGWPRISSAVFYDDAAAAIDWLCRVFGFDVRLRIEGENGRIEHSELLFGDGVVMVGDTRSTRDRPVPLPCRSPRSVGGANTQVLCVRVDDADGHCRRARAAGAEILDEPRTDDYGEHGAHRSWRARDPEGHHWWFLQVLRDPAA